jgi:transcriptional regulator with XRE-family HTH domain
MRVKTNTTIEEINHSISNLVAQWGVTPEDNEIIFNKIVGLQIKKIRFMRGKTLTRLVMHLELHFQQIQKYEGGKNQCSHINLKKICEYLSVDISYFTKPIDDANLILNKKGESIMSITSTTEMWQDRRIRAMNRIIKKNKFASEHLIEEYVGVLQSKHKTKQEYKREMYK